MLDKIALVLVIIGALNWGSIGIFSFDIVAWAFGGQASAALFIHWLPWRASGAFPCCSAARRPTR